MSEIEFLSSRVFFTTREYSFSTGKAIETSSRRLKRIAGEGGVVAVTKGIWCQPHHPYYTPYAAVPFLLGNEQGYVSFLSAMHRHGLLSQIPSSIQIATTGHGRKLRSPIGEFEFFHVNPALMREGVERFDGKIQYNIASAEKALFDAFYIATRRGKRFSRLPELELSEVDERKFLRFAGALPPIIRKSVVARWKKGRVSG